MQQPHTRTGAQIQSPPASTTSTDFPNFHGVPLPTTKKQSRQQGMQDKKARRVAAREAHQTTAVLLRMEEQFSGAKDRVSGSLADLKEIFVRELGAKGKVHWSELEQMLDQSDHELLDSRTGPPGTLRDGRANISTPLPSAASSESPVSKTRPRIQLPATAVAAEARSKLLVAKAAARARRQRLVERSRELGIEVSAVGKDLIDRVLHDVGGVGIDDVLEKTHLGMSDLKRSIGVHFQGMPRLLQVYGRGDLRAWRARSTAHVESNRLEVYHGT